MKAHTYARGAIFALAGLFAASCSSSKVGVANPEAVCRKKFQDAKKDYDKGNDAEAQKSLRDITVSCAGYDYVEESQYMLSQSHYRVEEWLEAETEFGILVSNWERSKYMEEARWKIARSSFNQSPTWDRDPALTQKAIEKEQSFLGDYPSGLRSDSARRDLADLIDRMAKRRYETALLYMKMDEPQAATIYYQLLLKEFPEAAQVGKARLDMSRAYAELDQFDRAQESLDSLQLDKARAEPLSKEIEKAKADLDKSRRKFEERKARETAEARQEKL